MTSEHLFSSNISMMSFDTGKWVNSYMSDAFSWDFVPQEVEVDSEKPVENGDTVMDEKGSQQPATFSWNFIPTRDKTIHHEHGVLQEMDEEYSPIYRLGENDHDQYLERDSIKDSTIISGDYENVEDRDSVQEFASNVDSQAESDYEAGYETDPSELSASIPDPVEWSSASPNWICPLCIDSKTERFTILEDHTYHRALLHPHKQERLTGRDAYRRQKHRTDYQRPACVRICYGHMRSPRDKLPASISSPHLYNPLSKKSKEVRLLAILPRDHGHYEIECELTIVSLDNIKRYEALSYTWGKSSSPLLPIRVNGRRVLIRTNLADALEGLRQASGRRVLWIDALCINQDDIDERNHQVGQMGDIYKQATQVLVWLGGEQASKELVTKYNRLYSLDHSYSVEEAVKCLKKLAQLTAFGQEESETYLFGDGLLALAYICGRAYWNRLWIVQEVLLASKLKIHMYFDGSSIDWDEWTKVRKLLENIPAEVQPSPMAMDAIEMICTSLPTQFDKQRENRLEGWPLYKLLTMCESSLCQDPRDKIYGLLGLANDFNVGDLAIDYSRSLFQVYTDAIGFHHFSHSKRHGSYLHTMAFSQLVQRALDGPLEVSINQSDSSNFIDSANLKATPPTVFCIGGLKRGHILPVDILLSDKNIKSLQQRDTLCVLTDYIPHLSRGRISAMLQELDALQRDRILPINSATSYASDKEEQYSVPIEILGAPRETCKETGTTFFVTSLGDFGLASTCMREGDILCRFADCDTAVIVRQQGPIYCLVCRAAVVSDRSLDGVVAESEGSHEDIHCWLSIDVIQDLTCEAKSTDKHELREDIFAQEIRLDWNE